MRTNRLVSALLSALLALTIAPAALAAPAEQAAAPQDRPSFGRVPEDRGPAHFRGLGRFRDAEPAAATLPGQPRNDTIADVTVVPGDASIPLNLIPYHDIPGELRALQGSDRISVEIIGESVEGRDIHLVVATSPMSDADWADWQELSDLRTDDPDAAIAALEAGEYDGWKSPLMVNNNIHGNEWEGTDASLQVLEELAFSDDADILQLLDEHLLVFIVTMNPDGRVNATRANSNGFDMNRDHITQSQPEVRVFRDNLIRYDPLTFLDQHGYVGPTLIEPTTGPHGDNYEYDLYIRHALRHALAMEERVLADVGDDLRSYYGAGLSQLRIPYRDNSTGWDDWPPIFTPMYAMYHGIVAHTIEFPLNPRSGTLSEAERHNRTRINTAVARATIEANFDWANEHRIQVLADQLELYRRGAEGAPLRPIDDPLALELARGDNADTVEIDIPRAYVIPTGADQRSERAAARLVQFLLDNDVQVDVANRPFTLEGRRYPAGSYVVDMHQAKRGLANTILDIGRDVTDAYPTMYDISAWSHSALWGASVDALPKGDLAGVARTAVSAPGRTGSVQPGRRTSYGLEVDSVQGVQAVNSLLAQGASMSRLPDGTFVVSGVTQAVVAAAATDFGVDFTNVTPARAHGGVPFGTERIGVSAFNDEAFTLVRMGFDVTTVTHTGFNAGTYAFDDFDAFYVGSGAFNPNNLDATQAAAFDAWLAGGGTIVGRGSNGVSFNDRAGLLDVSLGTAPNRANGIVAVDNDPTSAVTGGALDTAFVNGPRWFTSTGDGVHVDQRYAEGDFFLAGHWRATGDSAQEAAAGQPSVVSGTARGAQVTLFGTEPLYRSHPEGMFTQVAEALWRDGS